MIMVNINLFILKIQFEKSMINLYQLVGTKVVDRIKVKYINRTVFCQKDENPSMVDSYVESCDLLVLNIVNT